MKNKINTVLWVAIASLFLTSCGNIAQMQNPQKYSRAVTAPGVKPLHIGKVTPTRHGVYHVQVYERSVIFMATTQLITPSQVEVFDIDFDGTYDAVFLNQKNGWSVGVTSEFKEVNDLKIAPTLSTKEVYMWIEHSLQVHQTIQEQKKVPVTVKKVASTKKADSPKVQTAPVEKAPAVVEPKPEIATPAQKVEVAKKEEVQPQQPVNPYDGSALRLKKIELFDPTSLVE